MSKPVRVLVVDDQTIVRDGLVTLLGLLEGIAVVGSAADGEEAVRLAGTLQPDVVLMDLTMPRLGGVEATRQIMAAHQQMRVVVLTTYADDTTVFSALEAGARGYLTKDAGAEEIARAIHTVAAGEALLDPSVQRRLLEAFTAPTLPTAPRLRTPATALDGLTPRENDVLILIAAGHSNDEIATQLYVSEATVKTHINHIFAKTGLRDRAQLVAHAYQQGAMPHDTDDPPRYPHAAP